MPIHSSIHHVLVPFPQRSRQNPLELSLHQINQSSTIRGPHYHDYNLNNSPLDKSNSSNSSTTNLTSICSTSSTTQHHYTTIQPNLHFHHLSSLLLTSSTISMSHPNLNALPTPSYPRYTSWPATPTPTPTPNTNTNTDTAKHYPTAVYILVFLGLAIICSVLIYGLLGCYGRDYTVRYVGLFN